MTRAEAIYEACSIMGLAYSSIGNYRHASDCFCGLSPTEHHPGWWTYQNDGFALEYIRLAVVQRLLREGYTIHPDYDPKTGRHRNDETLREQVTDGRRPV